MKERKEQGITLVALMITIIILIILAAVTIITVANHNIIGKATTGAEEYAKAQQNEKNEIDEVSKILSDFEDKMSGGTVKVPEDFLNPDGSVVSSVVEKYIDYEPKGTDYMGPEGYTIGVLSGSTDNPSTYTPDSDLKWKIFGVEDGKLLLISDKPTSYRLRLGYANGYNNGVGLVDGICKANYMNSEYRGIEVRNLKIEDVQKVSTDYWTEITNSDGYKYGDTKTYTAQVSTYPNYWNSYDKEDTVPFNERSKQREWIVGNTMGTKKETFRQSSWRHDYSSSASQTEWKDPKYYGLIISPTNNSSYYPNYWLSSRFVNLDDIRCSFGLQKVQSGGVSGLLAFYSYSVTGSSLDALRPLVSIPLTSCTITQLDSSTYHILAR